MNDLNHDEEPLDLGGCCACGCTDKSVIHIIALEYRSPTPGQGWGCAICKLPTDGAIAVVCDACLKRFQNGEDVLKSAVSGYAMEKGRCDIKSLTEPFRHLDVPHN